MAKIKPMYRFCSDETDAGDTIPPGDNSYISRLGPHARKMEQAIRERSPAVAKMRDSCVYTYDDKKLAVSGRWGRQRQLIRENSDVILHLYKVEIDIEDLLYVADTNHYTAGIKASEKGDELLDDAVEGYLSGLKADGWDKPRWEFLASKVTVIKKLPEFRNERPY